MSKNNFIFYIIDLNWFYWIKKATCSVNMMNGKKEKKNKFYIEKQNYVTNKELFYMSELNAFSMPRL